MAVGGVASSNFFRPTLETHQGWDIFEGVALVLFFFSYLLSLINKIVEQKRKAIEIVRFK